MHSHRAHLLLCPVLATTVALSGCVTSVEIDRSRLPEPVPATATVAVAIFETTDEVKKDVVTSRTVVSEIVRTDVAPPQSVYRGTEARYVREGLAPGRYRIAAVAFVGDDGKETAIRMDPETLRVKAGERIRATVLLKKGPSSGFWTLGGLAAGVIIVAALIAVSHVGIDSETPIETNAPSRRFKKPIDHRVPAPVGSDSEARASER